MIYLDNCATTKPSSAAMGAFVNICYNHWGNPSSSHIEGNYAKIKLDEAREIIAKEINCSPDEIIFTSGGSESNTLALSLALEVYNNDMTHYFITSNVEHKSILNNTCVLPCIKCNDLGAVDKYSLTEDEEVIKHIKNDHNVSIMMVNNETGVINDIKELCAEVKSINPRVLFHTDAVQAVGHMKIDVKDLGVDMLSASAHKFGGFKGTGFLYVKKEVQKYLRQIIFGGHQEYGLRAGTENVAGIYAMAKALRHSNTLYAYEDNINKLKLMHHKLIDELLKNRIDYYMNSGFDSKLMYNFTTVNLQIVGCEALQLQQYLSSLDICIGVGSACNNESAEPSHVLVAMGKTNKECSESIRISFNLNNDVHDFEVLAKAIKTFVLLNKED